MHDSTAYNSCRRLSGFVADALFDDLPLTLVAQQGARRYDKSPCPSGTFGNTRGAKSLANCVKCPAGSFCREGTDQAKVRHVPVYRCSYGLTFAGQWLEVGGSVFQHFVLRGPPRREVRFPARRTLDGYFTQYCLSTTPRLPLNGWRT